MYDESVEIIENRRINGKYFKLIFKSRRLAKNVAPGQFMQIQIEPALDPFLRRPFSYYRVSSSGKIEIMYEVLGRGTALLARKKKGDDLRVLGPLGRGFTRNLKAGRKRILVAGGVGVPPLVFLAENVKIGGLLIGTKSKAEVLPKSELKNIKGPVFYSTNDGSYGKKGYVTKLLLELLKKPEFRNAYIQTCGPNVMMEAVIKIAREAGFEGEASVDKEMACGVGACLGCMVKTLAGWKPSCVEGPVFGFHEIESL